MRPSLKDQQSNQAGDSGPLIRHIEDLGWNETGGLRWAQAFGASDGTAKLTLDVCEVATGRSAIFSAGDSECVIYCLSGSGQIEINGRSFELSPGSGAFVRRREAFGFANDAPEKMRVLAVICPSPEASPWTTPAEAQGEFDEAFPNRVVTMAGSEREATGDRYFRILAGPKIGSKNITQFIGSIPRSRAPEHFHLYEEVICVLSGQGFMWAGSEKTAVGPGSLIFLPCEQPHCLECTVDEGLELVGMFYPAGSPAVNYKTGEQ